MSVEAIAWALNVEGVKASTKLVLIAIANYANEHGEAWPSRTTLAFHGMCNERTVSRAIAELRQAGLLEVEERWVTAANTTAKGGIRRATNIYILALPDSIPRTRTHINEHYREVHRHNASESAAEPSPLREDTVATMAEAENAPADTVDARTEVPQVEPEEPGKTAGQNERDNLSPSLSAANEGDRTRQRKGQYCHLPYIRKEPSLEPPHLTQPGNVSYERASAGMVGCGEVEASESECATPARRDFELACSCLPDRWLCVLGASQLEQLARLLEPLVADGWKPNEIAARLGANPLPGDLRNAYGLIRHRLLNEIAPLRPPGREQQRHVEEQRARAAELEAVEEAARLREREQLSPLERAVEDAWEALVANAVADGEVAAFARERSRVLQDCRGDEVMAVLRLLEDSPGAVVSRQREAICLLRTCEESA